MTFIVLTLTLTSETGARYPPSTPYHTSIQGKEKRTTKKKFLRKKNSKKKKKSVIILVFFAVDQKLWKTILLSVLCPPPIFKYISWTYDVKCYKSCKVTEEKLTLELSVWFIMQLSLWFICQVRFLHSGHDRDL